MVILDAAEGADYKTQSFASILWMVLIYFQFSTFVNDLLDGWIMSH